MTRRALRMPKHLRGKRWFKEELRKAVREAQEWGEKVAEAMRIGDSWAADGAIRAAHYGHKVQLLQPEEEGPGDIATSKSFQTFIYGKSH